MGNDITDSAYFQMGKNLLSLVGDDETVAEFEEGTKKLAGEMNGTDLDALVTGAALAGVQRSELRREMAAYAESDAAREHGPALHTREIELPSGDIGGLRVMCSLTPESVNVYRGDDSVLLRTPEGDIEQPLGFTPGDIEWERDTENISEFVVRPDADVVDVTPDLPADDDAAEDGDTDDDGD